MPARLPRVISITHSVGGPVALRGQLETLPRVSNLGVYEAPSSPDIPAGIRAVLDDRMTQCAVAPVPSECLIVDPRALKLYGLGHLLSEGQFPLNAESLAKIAARFGLRIPSPDQPRGLNFQMLEPSRYAQSERNLGDARGGYIIVVNPDGTTSTLFIKGVGQTPLCDPVRAQKGHSDGFFETHGGLKEATWSRVFQNLFMGPTPQTIGIFGIDHFIEAHDNPVPYFEQMAILARGGQMLRPAHVIEQCVYDTYLARIRGFLSLNPGKWQEGTESVLEQDIPLDGLKGTMSPEYFLRAAHATGVLRYHDVPGVGEVPDLQATILEILDRFARTAAESVVWRWAQLAPSAGNAEIGGGLVDLATATTIPRTAPMAVFTDRPSTGAPEYLWRAVSVKMMWSSLSLQLTPAQRQLYNFGAISFMDAHARSFLRHLGHQYLRATGLKDGTVQRVMEHSPEDVVAFRDVLNELANMQNPGPIPLVMTEDFGLAGDAGQRVVAKSVVDVFAFLGQWPKIYFEARARGQRPSLDTAIQLLDPIYDEGNPQSAQIQRANVRQLARQLVDAYDAIMRRAETIAVEDYDSIQSMQADVAARAAFRNQPIDRLYYWQMRHDIIDAISTVDPATGRSIMAQRDSFSGFVHTRAEWSMRNAAGLLRDRDVVVRDDGQVDVGVTMYGNTTYGIRADPVSGARQLFVQVPVGTADGAAELNLTGDGMSLASVDGAKLLYRMTEDRVVVAQGEIQAQQIVLGGYRYLFFGAPMNASQYGVFEGTLEIPGVPSKRLFEYAYASPDNSTVRELANRP